MPAKTKKPKPDWKKIAMELAQRVNFAQQYLKAPGTGTMFNSKTGEMRSWREYFADAMEMIPGLKVDREAMHALDLPVHRRRKYFNDRAKKKQTVEKDTTNE